MRSASLPRKYSSGTRDKVDSVHSVVFSIYVGGAEGTGNDSIKHAGDDKQNPSGVAVVLKKLRLRSALACLKGCSVEVIFVDNVRIKLRLFF